MIFDRRPTSFDPEIEVCGAYVLHQEKFLMLHRRDGKTEGGKWGLPAGKTDAGESKHSAMARELHEETGLKVRMSQITHHQSLDVRNEGHDLIFHIFSLTLDKQPEIIITEDEHQNHEWVTQTESMNRDYVHDLDECNRVFFSNLN